MANRKNTFLLKRSNVVNKTPSLGDIQLGEVALNTADAKLYSSYTGGLTGATEIRQIGWDRLSTISGGTVSGDVTFNDITVNTISATTYLNLPTSTDTFVTGGTFLSETLTLNRNDGNSVIVTGFTSGSGNNITVVTGSTYSASTTDDVIGIDSSTNTVTLYLPDSVSSGRLRYDIKDIGFNSRSNPITIQASGSDSIRTTSLVSSFTLSADGGAVVLINTATNEWWQM
jgi:hypothetical protein